MSKLAKTVVLVAVAVAVVVAAPYIGAWLAPALSGISAGLTAAAITSAIVGVGISLGATALMGLFRKVPNLSQSLADRLTTQVRPTAPRRIVFGLTAAGSDVRFEQTHDLPSTKKDGFSQVVALASHRINAIKSLTLDDVVTWEGGLVGKYAAGITMFRPVIEGKSNNGQAIPNTLWASSATFTGCAYYAATFKLDAEIFPSGPPTRRTVVVEGCPLYDPRLDSTRGGSGPHRVDNQATWAYHNGPVEIGRNPALALLTYLLGYRINGKLAWGMGIPATQINFQNFINYANICEERVVLQAGGTVQRYQCDAAFSTADTHETIINAITASMGSCKLVDAGGVFGLIGGYDDTAGPKVSLTADDILTGGYTWIPSPVQRERFNVARGQYCSAAEQYQLADWGEVRTDPLPDGYDRTLVLDLGAVTRAETAQRIAKQFLLREAKTPGVFSATFGPRAFAAEIGSLVSLSGVEGWQNKSFRVLDQSQAHELVFEMTLREESAEVYAWDREEKPLPASIRPPGYNPADTIAPVGLSLSSTSLAGANNVNISVINIAWAPELSGRVTLIELQSRASGSTNWTPLGGGDPKAGYYQVSSTVPGAVVDVRARYRMTTGVVSAWVQASVTTAAVEAYDSTARSNASTAVTRADTAIGTANNAASDATTALNAVKNPDTGQPYSLKQISDAVLARATLANLESERLRAVAAEEAADAKAVAAKTQADLAKVTADTAGAAVNDLKLAVRSRPNLVPNGGFERGMEG
ncbi:MAG: hypothetical protein ABW128_21850, partial [Rhizorhabdus sp.]